MNSFCLEFHSDTIQGAESEEYGFVDGKYNWKSDFKAVYVQAFQQQETTEKLNILNRKIFNCSRNDDVNSCISDITNLIGDISTPIFRPTPMRNSSEQVNFSKKTDTPWYDDKCEEKRHYFTYFLNKYRALKQTKINEIWSKHDQITKLSFVNAGIIMTKRRLAFCECQI